MEFRIAEVVALVGGTLVSGDEEVVLDGVKTLEEAGPGDLSFFSLPRYRTHFERTRAGAVLVTPDVDEGPDGVALIQVENPSYALAALAGKAEEMARDFTPGIRAGAHVSESAVVDAGAAIHPGAVVGDEAVIGPGSRYVRER